MADATKRTKRLTQLSLLIALLAVLAITPLGLIMIPPVAITTMHIPVIIGAILLGPLDGGILGGAFGMMAMLKATFSAASPVDIMFSPFISGKPVQSLIMCMVPRILLGVIAGYLYLWMKKTGKGGAVSIGICAGVSALSHSLLVLGCLWLFFSAMPLREVFLTIVTLNGLLELAAAILATAAICRPVQLYLRRQA